MIEDDVARVNVVNRSPCIDEMAALERLPAARRSVALDNRPDGWY
jgi:hypothetical protein